MHRATWGILRASNRSGVWNTSSSATPYFLAALRKDWRNVNYKIKIWGSCLLVIEIPGHSPSAGTRGPSKMKPDLKYFLFVIKPFLWTSWHCQAWSCSSAGREQLRSGEPQQSRPQAASHPEQLRSTGMRWLLVWFIINTAQLDTLRISFSCSGFLGAISVSEKSQVTELGLTDKHNCSMSVCCVAEISDIKSDYYWLE